MRRNNFPVIVGIAGGSGSGKTTIVETLVAELGPEQVALIQHDAYYRDLSHLPPEERDRRNFDHPEALETELLVEHLRQLRRGLPVQIPSYDFSTHTRRQELRTVEPRKVIIVEGILVLVDAALRELLDLRIFVEADDDLRFIRRLRRDVAERGRTLESVTRQHLETVRPMYLEHVEPSRRYAHLIIPSTEENRRGVQVLVAALRSLLG